MSTTEATVADIIAFDAWPAEQQELAKRVLWHARPDADKRDVDEIKEDLRDAEHSLDQARRALHLLEGKIK